MQEFCSWYLVSSVAEAAQRGHVSAVAPSLRFAGKPLQREHEQIAAKVAVLHNALELVDRA